MAFTDQFEQLFGLLALAEVHVVDEEEIDFFAFLLPSLETLDYPLDPDGRPLVELSLKQFVDRDIFRVDLKPL